MKNKLRNYYTTKYFEEYARLLLNKLYKFKLIHREDRYGMDRPDLISTSEQIGIEVTQSINEVEAKQNKVFQLKYTCDRDNEILQMAKRLGVDNNLKFTKKVAYFSIPSNKESNITELLQTIKNKIISINKKDYKIYKQNYLFIYKSCFESDIEDSIPEIQNILNQNTPSTFIFNKIYILNNDILFFIDKDKYSKTFLSKSLLTKNKRKALDFSKNHS